VSDDRSPEERIAALERENDALRRANAKLMRERLGSSNTAAASRIAGPAAKPRGAAATAVRSPFARARLAVRRALLRVLR
jgi:hypothetical protein